MEKMENKPTVLTLEQNGNKTINTHSWDANMYELLSSFIGACSSIGFSTSMINEVIKEYAETIEDEND